MALKKLKRKMSPMKAARKKPAPKKVARKAATKKTAPKSAMKTPKAAPNAKSKARAGAKPKATVATAVPVAKRAWLFPPVVHWEIQAADAGNQRAFYTDLFGWSIDANNPQNYGMVGSAGDGAIGGGISSAQDGKSYVTFYVEVPDINASLAKAESLGGSTVMPRMDIGMVILAQFRDPEGNVIGLIESTPSSSSSSSSS
jgi:predicted enzyme related to lactoylglutathione lyase